MKPVFDDIDGYVVLTSHSDAYIFRSGDFCADNDRQTKPIALPLVHAHRVMSHCSTFAKTFVPRSIWAWQSPLSHAVENRPFYASLWSSTISGKNIARLSNIGSL